VPIKQKIFMSFPDFAKYKNIIFDLGGVILNIDYQLSIKAFQNLGIANFEMVYSQAQQERLFDLYETGHISSEDFINGICGKCGLALEKEGVIAAWNAMLLDLPMERLNLLEKLKSHYRTFLLSNTNEIHISAYSKYLSEEFGFASLGNYFEKQYLSYEIGLRKPDKEVFEFVLQENGLKPGETLFIDDSIQHIEGAKSAGIDAFHLTGGLTINTLFKAI
jgi:glucose-1-phosphatase